MSLAEYQLGNRIAKGGFGTIYEGLRRRDDCKVAIKILREDAASERFAREARLLARLHHKNVVRFMDYGDESGQKYLVMEYVNGLNVDEFFRKRLEESPTAKDITNLILRIARETI